jgi:hypothetical protein
MRREKQGFGTKRLGREAKVSKLWRQEMLLRERREMKRRRIMV